MHSHGTSRKLEERGPEEMGNRSSSVADKVQVHVDGNSRTDFVSSDACIPMRHDGREENASGDPTPLLENGMILDEDASGDQAVPRSAGEAPGREKVRCHGLTLMPYLLLV